MIYSKGDNKPTTGVYAMSGARELAFTAVYIGARMIWEAVKSCYGKGIWLPEKPWLDNDTWKNNK